MKAKLIYHNKLISDDYIIEMIMWELPAPASDMPHGIKYRLYCGNKAGRCMVRYDNEAGKGDHKHLGNTEVRYHFSNVELLMKDFLDDVATLTGEVTQND
jgi:hypothetical protein